MNCSFCTYQKSIPLFTKCAGVSGRTRAGTSYYCSHPDIDNPVPMIPESVEVLDDCPFLKELIDASPEEQEARITGI